MLVMANKEQDHIMTEQLMTKEQWVTLFRDTGLDDRMMHKWHKLFEQRHPDAHAQFLFSLGLPKDEVENIRRMSAV